MIETALLASALIQSLTKIKWNVRRRGKEDEGSGRIDLIVTGPNGKVFLVELKGGDDDPMHFAEIAQLERAAHELSQKEGEEITPVLLTTHDVLPTISEVADEVGVEVVEASGSAQEAAESCVLRLEAAQ
jgi:hypothetical protein